MPGFFYSRQRVKVKRREEKISIEVWKLLKDSDLSWMMANTFDGYRPYGLEEAHKQFVNRLMAKDAALSVSLQEADLKERNRIWEEERRQDYIKRNGYKHEIVYTEDFW